MAGREEKSHGSSQDSYPSMSLLQNRFTNISIIDEQKTLSLSYDTVREVVLSVLESEGISCNEVEIHLVDKEKICSIHEQFFQDSSPTDCISFPIDDPEEEGFCLLGIVFVCTDVAVEYAKEHELDSQKEAHLYLIHSLLHLIGYDDLTEEEQRIMRKKEKSYMELLKAITVK